MKRIEIDAARCTEGLWISSTVKKLGVNENRFKSLSMKFMNIVKDLV
jgi:hypothetical protein